MSSLQMQARRSSRSATRRWCTGVVSASSAPATINATPNTGRLTIALKPRRERDLAPAVIATGCRRRWSGVPGLSVFMQAVQDIQIGTRISRTQFQYTLLDTDAEDACDLGAAAAGERLRAMPDLRDVASDQQTEGFSTRIQVDRDAAMRLGVTMQEVQDTLYDAFGQRQISTIFSQANQYRVVLEADPDWQADPHLARPAAGAGAERARRCRCRRSPPSPAARSRRWR